MTPGICKLLFETPSGFAIFSFDMQYLQKDIEDTWHYFVGDYWHYCILALHAFRKFEDKSNAINITTREAGGRLTRLLFEYCLADELIVVGKPEYKSIIEEKLRLPCLCNEMVMEVMWGLQNLMPLLIPQEKSEFKKVDRLPICKGLDMLLSRHGINNVKQELINEHILRMALKVYHADLRENEHSMFLRRRLYKNLKASGFDVKDWDLLKLATALMSMVDPDGARLTRAEYNMFSTEEHALMDHDAPKYEDLIDRTTISKIYDDIVAVRAYVVKVLLKLRHLLKKAEAALETEDVLEKAATNGVDSMRQVDHTCLAVGPVLVPNQSSIAEEQQRNITCADGEEFLPDLGDSMLPTSQKNNEPITSVEGMNLENEAEKASLGEQMNTILDVVRNDLEDPAQEISGNVPLIEVIATNKDTPVAGTTQDVAQHADTQAQEIDAEQIINAQVKNRGMPTNNGDGGERAEATDLSRGMHTNNSEGERAEATDLSMSFVDLVEVPSQSSIDEDQQHITGTDGEECLSDLPDSTLPTSQKNYEPSTSVEGTNQEDEAEKASSGEQRNTILDGVRKEPAQEIGGKVTSIEEVIATNKDTPAVGTTQDVAQDANTQAEEIDAEEIINALVKNRGMHTNNGEGGEQADEDITGGGEQADEDVTDLSKSSERTFTEKIEIIPGEGGKQAEVTDLSKNSERTFTEKIEIIADKGGKQAEATDLSKSLERTSTENKEIVAGEDITGLADLSLSLGRTSTDKK